MDAKGTIAGSWTIPEQIPDDFGTQTVGAGIAVADINGDGRPDILVFHIESQAGTSLGFYRIGWNIDGNGRAESWSAPMSVPGNFGSKPEGAGVAIADQASVDEELADTSALGAAAALPRSAPTTISIPRIGVQAEIMSLGTNPDGTVQVPPLDQAQRAGWYSPGASPGEVGNAVVVGHVDSAKLGPAVFFNLGSLKPGDTITVTREDGSQATFAVDEVKSYPKTAFPTELVYGPGDKPGLRVVTCGGVFDRSAGSYLNNIVVFATMTT
jgi:hypothetical protein